MCGKDYVAKQVETYRNVVWNEYIAVRGFELLQVHYENDVNDIMHTRMNRRDRMKMCSAKGLHLTELKTFEIELNSIEVRLTFDSNTRIMKPVHLFPVRRCPPSCVESIQEGLIMEWLEVEGELRWMVDTECPVHVVWNRGNIEVLFDVLYVEYKSNMPEFHLLSLNNDTTGSDWDEANPKYGPIKWNGEKSRD